MKRTQIVGLSGLVSVLVLSLIPLGGVNQARARHELRTIISPGNCVTSPKVCKAPVKYLGERDGCACFTCEYGKPNQFITCSADANEKVRLMTLARTR